MPFYPWKEHHPVNGICTVCRMEIPNDAVANGLAYSHVFSDGRPVFCNHSPGRSEPCLKSTDK